MVITETEMANNNINTPPQLPLLTRFKLSALGLARRIYTRHDGTVNRRLFNLLNITAPAPATKLIDATTISTSDIHIDPSRDLWFRLFIPDIKDHSDKSLPLIVYIHGGGFNIYGPDTKIYDTLCSHLAAKAQAVVASINYRLTPEHKFPSQYDDAFDALKFIDAQNSAVLPANTVFSKCFIAGDSAGGNIAHHVTVRALKNDEQFNKIRIIGMVAVQPFFGGEERTEPELRLENAPVSGGVNRLDALWRHFLPEGADRNHPAAHVFGGGAYSESALQLKNLDFPSTLAIVGGQDPLQDWQRRYVEWLKNCGKEVEMIEFPNSFHGFFAFPELPECALFIEKVTNFVQKQANSN